jgi:tetrahydromethanopterin S-methyltransferase subunit A
MLGGGKACLKTALMSGERINGARGKRPVLENVTPEEIESFRHQVQLVEGGRDPARRC